MPPKSKTPAPIDRPLSRAYLRQFVGWSTAFPPGVSEPTSLRLMENVMVNRDGSCRVRPGLRYFNYDVAPTEEGSTGVAAIDNQGLVGSHETFFTNDGNKAYLYAVLEDDGYVGFRVFADDGDGNFTIQSLTEAGFSIPQGETTLNFTGDTTYVKYVQIDNKVFALSNNGESMRMFSVGEEKKAQRLYSIDRPDWNLDDKLTVVHPDESWITGGTVTSTRVNRVKNPSVKNSLDRWSARLSYSEIARSDDIARTDSYSIRVRSLAERRNICKHPLHDTGGAPGVTGWEPGTGADTVANAATYMRTTLESGEDFGQASSSQYDVEGNTRYRVGLTMGPNARITKCQLRVFYYNSSGDQISNAIEDSFIGISAGRKETDSFVTPGGARTIRIAIRGDRDSGGNAYFDIKNVYIGTDTDTTALDGDDGADYYWVDGSAPSESVYHPPQTVSFMADVIAASPNTDYYASCYARAGTTVRDCHIELKPTSSTGAALASSTGSTVSTGSGTWQRVEDGITTPSATAYLQLIVVVEDVPRGEYHYFDDFLLEKASALDDYFSGATDDVVGTRYEWDGDAHDSFSYEYVYTGGDIASLAAETKTADTLISSTSADNDNSFGFFYTFSNEIGESAASQMTTVRAQRPWSSWKWETPNAAGEPSGTAENDPELCADQLVAYMPEDAFNEAISQGAIAWSLYMFTWSDQDPFPVSAVLLKKTDLTAASDYDYTAWARATPSQAEVATDVAAIPTKGTRLNSSYPSHGGQGIVAADRMVMVFDPVEQAVIRWSSNQQGSYYDFSPNKGGGFKTLTSGNLFIPACVKLWQNPQSVDTLTILCLGVDGYSTGYYMQPAQIASQSEAVNVMGFEETTATPGTTSPYGCEVLNNSLYHPLDDQLMKSTASNYNINHLSVTDKILDQWQQLQSKEQIVSCHLDNRLYYLVHNPEGATLEVGCWGNEVWVFDAQQKAGTWSRWTVQGHSLRKIERAGKIVMSLIHPTGIFYFDMDSSTDDYVDTATGDVLSRNIPWLMETNTQGANRAHDAWANLQQANLVLGNFQGQLRYGIRGLDINGKMQDISKIVLDSGATSTETWDLEDYLLIRRTMKEWFFYAESTETDDVVDHSAGQISLVQYRYTPSTVNTGYEFGSVETFEYGRAVAESADRNTDSGVPMPYIDTGRP